MIKYTGNRPIAIEEFKTPFRFGLDKNNRWVRMANEIPWDDLVNIYSRSLSIDFGRPSVSPRVVIGALIIKHLLGLSDEETIETIRENPYCQYFLGYEEFSHDVPFDASLFVYIRRRLGQEEFNEMTDALILRVEEKRKSGKSGKGHSVKDSSSSGKKTKSNPQGDDHVEERTNETSDSSEDANANNHQGMLILDATVAPADIKYPSDLDLLNTAREKSEQLIDILYKPAPGKVKPRTYRRVAHKAYLSIAKKRKKNKKDIRKAIRKQLNYLGRNIRTIHKLLDAYPQMPLSHQALREFWIIQELYRQQLQMYEQKTHQISHRIVSISQPHVRPIVRGKAGKAVEFGAQVSVSYVNGYVYVDRISWESYHEGEDLVKQVEEYRRRFGCYPEVVVADKKYGCRENRQYLKSKGIRFSGKPLGRPPKELNKLIKEERRRLKEAARQRVKIEGKFGQGKRGYDLGLVKAKWPQTGASWIGVVFFVMKKQKKPLYNIHHKKHRANPAGASLGQFCLD